MQNIVLIQVVKCMLVHFYIHAHSEYILHEFFYTEKRVLFATCTYSI